MPTSNLSDLFDTSFADVENLLDWATGEYHTGLGISQDTLHMRADNVADFTVEQLQQVAAHIEARWESYERLAQIEAGAIHGAIEDELAKRNA